MMRALFWKELRGLKAAALLMIGIEIAAGIYDFATEVPDNSAFDPTRSSTLNSPLVVGMFFGFFLGASLLRREAIDGTLHFLDGLPVSRTQIFLAKISAGYLVLCAGPLLEALPALLFGLLSRTSVSPPFPWAFYFALLGLYLLGAAYSLSISTVLAFLGKYFGLATGLLFLAVVLFQQHGMPWVETVNPTELLPHWTGGSFKLPLRAMTVQGVVTAVALFFAWLWFRGLGARSRDAFDRDGWLARSALFLARAAAPIVWLIALLYYAKTAANEEDAAPDRSAPHEEAAFANETTKHYEFLYRDSERDRARPLLKGVDSIYERVAGFFAAPDRPEPIVADLDSPMPPHMLGVTNWSKIRTRLYPDETVSEFRQVLGHETSHVVMKDLGGEPFLHQYEATRFFNEGMATVAEKMLFGSKEDLEAMRTLAAAVAARGAVPFDLLCDDGKLSETRDPVIVYPLGAVFGQAVMRVCGDKAPAHLVAAFKSLRIDSKEKGSELWRRVFQNCHYSFDAAVAAYDEDLNRLQIDQAAYLKTLPRLTADVETTPNSVIIHPKYEGKAPGKLVCCIAPPSLLGPDLRYKYPNSDGTIRVSRSDFAELKIRYMLGWDVKGLPLVVFEPWAEKN